MNLDDAFGGCFIFIAGGFLVLAGATMAQKLSSPAPGILAIIIGAALILFAISCV